MKSETKHSTRILGQCGTGTIPAQKRSWWLEGLREEPSHGLFSWVQVLRHSKTLPSCLMLVEEQRNTCCPSTPSHFSSEAVHLWRAHSQGTFQCYLRLSTQKPGKAEGKGDCCELKGLTLSVELFTDPFTPLFAQIPDPARVANVSTLECNLKARRKVVVRKEVTV